MLNIEQMAKRYADPSDPEQYNLYVRCLRLFEDVNKQKFQQLMEDKKIFSQFDRVFKKYLKAVRAEEEKRQRLKRRRQEILEERFELMMINEILAMGMLNNFFPDPMSFKERVTYTVRNQ